MRRRDKVNCDLVSLSVDWSHEELVRHKCVSAVLALQKPTACLSATSKYELFSVHTNDKKYLYYQLSTTDDEENDKNWRSNWAS